MGQPEQGWEEFERLLQTDRAFSVPTRGKSSLIKGSEVWQSIKDPIVEDFKKELSEPN